MHTCTAVLGEQTPYPPCASALDLPGVPSSVWPELLTAAAPDRIALVGGAVRDWLLHHQHRDPWRGLVDLDLVIEGASAHGTAAGARRPDRSSPAWRLTEHLIREAEGLTVRNARPHGQYGTVELELEVWQQGLPDSASAPSSDLLLDVASARGETYPIAAANPEVWFGALEDDLARRDLTINAMAIDLATGALLDPHGGQADLAGRHLRFLHPRSLRDDPTRLVRAARYAARLGFALAAESEGQVAQTLATWPWAWHVGDPPGMAPAALGTRLRRELDLLLERENWRVALRCLQEWGGLLLLDPALQGDPRWVRRLQWGLRLGLPPMVVFIAVAQDPLALAERLQLPHQNQQMLRHLGELRYRLALDGSPEGWLPRSAWQWCELLEAPGLSPPAIALALASGLGPRRPLLRWYLRWRHVGPDVSAHALMASGVPQGPQLGVELRRSREKRLQKERP